MISCPADSSTLNLPGFATSNRKDAHLILPMYAALVNPLGAWFLPSTLQNPPITTEGTDSNGDTVVEMW